MKTPLLMACLVSAGLLTSDPAYAGRGGGSQDGAKGAGGQAGRRRAKRFVRTHKRPGAQALIPGQGTGIYPAHEVRRDGSFTMEVQTGGSGQRYRKFRQLAEHVGEEAAYEIFAGLHPFVQNTYGEKVPVIGISANTMTGASGSASGGVDADVALSHFLNGTGPMPAAMRAISNRASGKGTRPQPYVFKLLREQPARASAEQVLSAVKLAVEGDHRSADLAAHRDALRAIELAGSLPGSFRVVTSSDDGITLRKTGRLGKVELLYIPGSSIALRLEPAGEKAIGYAFAVRKNGNGRIANLSTSELTLEVGPTRRFIPQGRQDSQVLLGSEELVAAFALGADE